MSAETQEPPTRSAADHAYAVAATLASLPTAPLHEAAVARALAGVFAGFDFTLWQDRFGNLFARRRRGRGARPLALVAHMDHPGLGVTRVHGGEVTAEVLGGIAASVLAPGAALRLYQGDDTIPARVTQYFPAVGRFRATVSLAVEQEPAPGAFGVLDLPEISRVGDYLALRAADDLAQCACAALVAERLAMADDPFDVTFVFTRAEELGLIGATLVAQSGMLAPQTLIISLECSRALPGAEIGHGPVIRVGDATQTFHPEGEALLLAAREQLLASGARDPALSHAVQRQLMSGGSCEATSFSAYGYVATGMILPLGNYHNADVNGQAAPEFIHLNDLLGGVDLLLAAVAESAQALPERRSRLARLAERTSGRLMESAGAWQLGLPAAPVEAGEL